MASSFNYVPPHTGEILIVIGSVGIVTMIYKLADTLLSINEEREIH